jgi:hypothetical protein
MTTDDHQPSARAGRQTGRPARRMRSAMTSRTQGWRWAAVAVAAPVLVPAVVPAAARPAATSVRTVHLVAHETQRKFPGSCTRSPAGPAPTAARQASSSSPAHPQACST